MGAFLLFEKGATIQEEKARKLFISKGFSDPNKFSFENYNLHLYKKIKVDQINYFEKDNSGIYIVGTLIYKANSYFEGIQELLEDYLNDCIDYESLTGNYFVLFRDNLKLKFLIDRASVQTVYYSNEHKIVSSSFLAMAEAFPERLTINKDACVEALTTGPGSLIWPILGLNIVAIVGLSMIIFKEKLNKKGILGFLLAVIAIFLLR